MSAAQGGTHTLAAENPNPGTYKLSPIHIGAAALGVVGTVAIGATAQHLHAWSQVNDLHSQIRNTEGSAIKADLYGRTDTSPDYEMDIESSKTLKIEEKLTQLREKLDELQDVNNKYWAKHGDPAALEKRPSSLSSLRE